MQNLQDNVQKILKDHKRKNRYVAFLIVLSMLVSIIVPTILIMPAVSMSKSDSVVEDTMLLQQTVEENGVKYVTNAANADGNVVDGTTYSPQKLSEKTLLIGDGVDWAEGCRSAEEVIEAAKNKYFLGIASDFCVFLENDFNPTAADTEGRAAVGGDLIFTNDVEHKTATYNYQIANGDFAGGSDKALSLTDNYNGREFFAHAIVGGKMCYISMLYKDATNSLQDYYKRFVVGNPGDSLHKQFNTDYTTPDVPYQQNHRCSNWNDSPQFSDELSQIYTPQSLINFNQTFEWLRNQSELLSKKTAIKIEPDGNILTLTVPDNMKDAKVIYFDIPAWENYQEIHFENVPTEASQWNGQDTIVPKCNLVINCGGSSFNIDGNTIKTTINGTVISNTGGDASNNHPASEKILYNFYEAKGEGVKSYIKANFNGTIFAPNAEVESDNGCRGHLSGSLIAKSFKGGMEFGYRPYRGGVEILGATSGYTIPVNKLLAGTESFLPGATLTITDDSDNSVKSIWTSKDTTEYENAKIPTAVDFSGDTDYRGKTEEELTITKTYTLSEQSAPEGFIQSNQSYIIDVTEAIDPDYLLPNSNNTGTFPQKVTVTVTITPPVGDATTLTFTIKDAYDVESGGLAQRRIYIGNEIYAMDIASAQSRTIAKLGKIDNIAEGSDEEIVRVTTTTAVTTEETTTTTAFVEEQNILGAMPYDLENCETEATTDATEPETEAMEAFVDEITLQMETAEVETEATTDVTEPQTEETEVTTEITTEIIEEETEAVQEEFMMPLLGETDNSSYKRVNVVTIPDDAIISIEDLTKAQTIEDAARYYDPKSLMVMPLPSAIPTFENRPGLLFQKQDDSGKALTGATITLTPSVEGWQWDATSSSCLIDVKKLNVGTEYCFEETSSPSGYEIAKKIFFIYKGNNQVEYWTEGETTYNTLDLNAERTIVMTDNRILGARPSLKKVDTEGNVLEGATLQLYAKENDTFICEWENFSGEETSMEEALKAVTDTTYVENGYLKPGVYYLRESVVPTRTDGEVYENPGDMYFTVKNDFTIENGYIDSIQLAAPTHPQDGNKQWLFNFEKNIIIKSIYVETSTNTETIKVYEASGLDGTTFRSGVLFEKQSNETSKIKFQENSYNEFNITYVEIIDADGLLYVYGSKSTTTSARSSAVENNVLAQADGDTVSLSLLTDDSNIKRIGILNQEINNIARINIKSEGGGGLNKIYDAGDFGNENIGGSYDYTATSSGTTISSTGIQLQPKNWDNTFKITYVEFIASDGTKYVYDPNNTGGGSGDPGGSGEDPGGGSSSEPITNPNLSVSGNLLTVKNKLKGDETDVEVVKKWEDGSFQTGRSEITVQLYRSTKAIPFDQLATKLTEADKVEDKTATLNTDNGWTYKWENLPSRSTEDDPNNPGKKLLYHYYVQETGVPSGYTVSYSQEGDKLVVTNTLKTIDLNVKKVWSVPNGVTVEKPDRLEVKLQWKNGENWEDVPGVAHLTLTADATGVYESKFENLPEGKTYRAVEVSIPTGWKLFGQTESNIDGGMLTITNEAILGELQVKKEWNGDTESDRPAEVKLKLYRSTTSSSNTGSTSSGTAPNFDPNLTSNLYPVQTVEEVQEDYARLLQYSLYFYDANMCGDTVEETSAYSWRKNCHTYDGDYAGGFHDAGDHVMFGLPQGYSASTLGWSLYEFKDSYNKLGLTSHIQYILDYFNDFFKKSCKFDSSGNISEILCQKGNGGTDHSYWGRPEKQQQSQRGDLVWSSNSGSEIAAEYAASLALQYLNFKDTEALDLAKKYYDYSVRVNNKYTCSEYNSETYRDDQAWAAAWLAVATGEENYKTACQNHITQGCTENTYWTPNGFLAHQWNNVLPAAKVVNAAYLDGSWDDIKTLLSDCTGSSYKCDNDWGSARYNTGFQLIALAANKHNSEIDKNEWCKNQMAYLLGNNNISSNGNSSTCFITGFAANSPKFPHYRATCDERASSDQDTYPDVYTLVGALVGGPNTGGYYNDSRTDYATNEVALDYNANLVMAAAGLYSVYHTGSTYSNVTQSSQPQQTSSNSAVQEKNVALMQAAEWEAEGVLSNDTATVSDDGNATKSVRAAGTSDMDFVQIVGAAKEYVWKQEFENNKDYVLPSDLNNKNIISADIYFNQTFGNQGVIRFDNWKVQKTLTTNTTGMETIDINTENLTSIICSNNGYGDFEVYKIVLHYTSIGSSFTVIPDESEIVVGNSTNLTITGAEGDITWNCDDSGCTISGNTLTAGKQTGDFTITGTDADGKTGEFTIKVVSFAITPSNVSLLEGETKTLSANKAATWSVNSNNVTLKPSEDGKSCDITAGNIVESNITVTAVDNAGNNATAIVSITPAELTVEPIQVRVGKTATITVTPSTGIITYGAVADPTIATIDGNTITGVAAGNTTVSVTRNGISVDVPIAVIDGMSIQGIPVMGLKKTQQLQVEGAIGTVTWESNNPDILTIDDEGNVTSNTQTGEVKITARDSSGESANFDISVQVIAETPELPEDQEFVTDITLNKDGSWSKALNLPLTDENGRTYYYYIVEVDKNGNPAETIQGSGAKYIPISYENNASSLNEGSSVVMTVVNKLSEKSESYELPSTGGIGTRWYTISGLLVLGGGCGGFATTHLIRRFRKRKCTK